MNLQGQLGVGPYQPKAKYVCFLPFRGEFGWYIMMYVKRFHAYHHERKVVCTKAGHECLFPTAHAFFYDWRDNLRGPRGGWLNSAGGVDETTTKGKVMEQLGDDDVVFIGVGDGGREKLLYRDVRFVPANHINHGFRTDVVLAPRLKDHDPHRNLGLEFWQAIVDEVRGAGLSVSTCGGRQTSYLLTNVERRAADYVDIDTDVELMRSAKVVVTQDSGLLYLAFLCERPVVLVDNKGVCVEAQHANREQPLCWVQRGHAPEDQSFAHRVAAEAIRVAKSR